MTVEFIGEEGSLYAAEVSSEGRFLSDAVIAHIADIAQEHGGNYAGEGDHSIQLGNPNSQGIGGRSRGYASTAIGYGAETFAGNSIAMGTLARTGAEGSPKGGQVAIGDAAEASGIDSVALGAGASSPDDYTMVLGKDRGARASDDYLVKVPGRLILSDRQTNDPNDAATVGMVSGALDLAYPSRSEGGNFSVALGRIGRAGTDAVAIGGYANSLPDRAVAVGYSTKAEGARSTAVGALASSRGDGSTAVGSSSSAVGASSVAIGGGLATGLAGIAIGASTNASGILSMSIGALAGAAPANTAVIGPEQGLNEDMTPSGDPYTVRVPGALELSEHNTLPEHAARRDWVEQYVAENGGGGEPGADGLSAYEVAVEDGFEGTESEWLASLRGADAPLPEVAWDGPRLIVGGETSPDLTGPASTTPGPPGPPGAVPTAGDFAIVGPGRPDVPASTGGLVTASTPVGATYTSTDGAGVGAFVWRKRPDGSWQVVDGDTGWRSLGTMADGIISISIKRVLGSVLVRIESNGETVPAGRQDSANFPQAGWAPDVNGHDNAYVVGSPLYRNTGSQMPTSDSDWAIRSHASQTRIEMRVGTAGESRRFRAVLTYPTSDHWPNTLP